MIWKETVDRALSGDAWASSDNFSSLNLSLHISASYQSSSNLAALEMTKDEPGQPGTLKEMSQGGRNQSLEWATVHTLAWKHDIAKGGKTPFYHSVRFAPTLPVKHAICPRHRSSCSHIGCDRAIHTLLPIRHHLLQIKKKKKVFATRAQWQAVRQRASTLPGPQLRGSPFGGAEGRGHDGRCSTAMKTPNAQSWRWQFSSF